ncbi:ras-related protein RABD2c [Drosophila eugracilis]|uniref:ras-related protein RABD2c n=1 Tax=Drosophila eugracilis TaxID=29029 RepID=UPI0007E72751|nr:ras-related protein RABD2c [Drosophila eugracilis]
MMCDYKYLFKILVLGDCGVGKSCLLMRFTDGRFTGQYLCTVGVDFKVRTVEVAGQVVKLQIWDTAGEERFRSVLPTYYRGAHGVLLVYDTTSLSSFQNIDSWLEEIRQYCPEMVSVLLVGNKCDELESRQVSQEQAAHYAESRAVPFRETSAKSGANVNHIFAALAVAVYNRLVAKPRPSIRMNRSSSASDRSMAIPPTSPCRVDMHSSSNRLMGGQELANESEDIEALAMAPVHLTDRTGFRNKNVDNCC